MNDSFKMKKFWDALNEVEKEADEATCPDCNGRNTLHWEDFTTLVKAH